MTIKPTGNHRRIGLDDFSRSAINKAVTSKGFQDPLFLYPTAAGILSCTAMLVVGLAPVWAGLGAAGLGVGLAALGYQLGFRREQLARDYLNNLHMSLNNRRLKMVHDLTGNMDNLQFHQGLRQLGQMQKKFQNFVEILNRTFDPQELTYGRYLGIAEQVYLSGLDNLERVVGALASVQTIDSHHIETRIKEIHSDGIVTEAEATEEETLNQRKLLRQSQTGKVEKLMAQNEQAMTQLDLTAAALAEMNTHAGQATMNMESAMTELQDLIARSSEYNRTN